MLLFVLSGQYVLHHIKIEIQCIFQYYRARAHPYRLIYKILKLKKLHILPDYLLLKIGANCCYDQRKNTE